MITKRRHRDNYVVTYQVPEYGVSTYMGSSTQCNAMPSLIRQTRHAKERKRKKTKINNKYLPKEKNTKKTNRKRLSKPKMLYHSAGDVAGYERRKRKKNTNAFKNRV